MPEETRAPASVTCPKCGNDDLEKFRHREDAHVYRNITVDPDGRVYAEGYEIDYEHSDNPHLLCKAENSKGHECLHAFPIPDELARDLDFR